MNPPEGRLLIIGIVAGFALSVAARLELPVLEVVGYFALRRAAPR